MERAGCDCRCWDSSPRLGGQGWRLQHLPSSWDFPCSLSHLSQVCPAITSPGQVFHTAEGQIRVGKRCRRDKH